MVSQFETKPQTRCRSKRSADAYHGRVPLFPGSLLICPVCSQALSSEPPGWPEASAENGPPHLLRCEQGHRFDAARQGYFNLLTGKGTGFQADTAAMVQARIDFLRGGHFLPLAEAVADAVAENAVERPAILDAGAGTGYYLQAVRRRVPEKAAIALDISKFALRRAARLLPGVLCLVCDVWRPLPVADHCVDLIINIFAPRNPPEFARVMKGGGVLVVVTPRAKHLQEIAESAGLLGIHPGKESDLAASLEGAFDRVDARELEYAMTLSPSDIRNVAAMGPAGHHQLPSEPDSLSPGVPVTAAFTVHIFRRRHTHG